MHAHNTNYTMMPCLDSGLLQWRSNPIDLKLVPRGTMNLESVTSMRSKECSPNSSSLTRQVQGASLYSSLLPSKDLMLSMDAMPKLVRKRKGHGDQSSLLLRATIFGASTQASGDSSMVGANSSGGETRKMNLREWSREQSSLGVRATMVGASKNVSGDVRMSGIDLRSSLVVRSTMVGPSKNVSGDLSMSGTDLMSSLVVRSTMVGPSKNASGDLSMIGTNSRSSREGPRRDVEDEDCKQSQVVEDDDNDDDHGKHGGEMVDVSGLAMANNGEEGWWMRRGGGVVCSSSNVEESSFEDANPTFGRVSKFGSISATKWATFGGGSSSTTVPDHNDVGEFIPSFGMPEDIAGSAVRRSRLPTVTPSLSIRQLRRKEVSRNQSLRHWICDAADSFVTAFLTPLSELKESIDPGAVLRGISAPVDETPPTHCRLVYGHLPPDLSGGVYLRNGPNPRAIHQGDGYHIFDGDGMLHAVKLPADGAADGRPIYCSRFVQTSRFRQEKELNRPLMPKFIGGLYGIAGAARFAVTILRWILGIFELRHGWGLSNTNICYFNGHILSLSEDDLPYVIRVSDDGDLSTVGRFRLPSKYNMCAHPKFDPISGDMYAFCLNLPWLPLFSFFRLSAVDGAMSGEVPVPLFDIPFVHDFAITEKFVVFPDSQVVFRPLAGYDARKTPSLCLIRRDTPPEESSPMWFEAPGINCLHYLNAWEEGEDEVVVVAPVLSPLERILEFKNASSTLSEIRLNKKTGRLSSRPICPAGGDNKHENLEFGVINPEFTGKKMRYAYLATGTFPRLTGVVKVDLWQPLGSAVVAKRDFAGEGCYGGEPLFVPATGSVSEDDGYLLCLVGNEKKDVSHLLIMDAQSPSLRVMAAVELPTRVPAGFHGCFVTADQLAYQKEVER